MRCFQRQHSKTLLLVSSETTLSIKDVNYSILSRHSCGHFSSQLRFQCRHVLSGFILPSASFHSLFLASRLPRGQAVDGSTPLEAGMTLLPYSLGSSLASLPAAWFIGFWQRKSHDMSGQKWVICIGLVISSLGFGLCFLVFSCLLCSYSLLSKVFSICFTNGRRVPYELCFLSSQASDLACCFMRLIRFSPRHWNLMNLRLERVPFSL